MFCVCVYGREGIEAGNSRVSGDGTAQEEWSKSSVEIECDKECSVNREKQTWEN